MDITPFFGLAEGVVTFRAVNFTSNVGRVVLVAALVSACGKPAIKYPATKQVSVGNLRTDYRDYVGFKVCQLEPQPVAEDITRMNDFLRRVLDAAQAAKGGSGTEEQYALLQAAPKALKGPLASHESLVKRVPACKEFQGQPVVEAAQKGQQLVADAKQTLGQAGDLVASAKASQELKAWHEKQETEQLSERANWCPAKPSKTPEIYFAWEDENGVTEWLFCDGSKVVSNQGKPPEFMASPDLAKKPGKPPAASTYLTSAQKYPATEIRRAPKPSGAATEPPPPAPPPAPTK